MLGFEAVSVAEDNTNPYPFACINWDRLVPSVQSIVHHLRIYTKPKNSRLHGKDANVKDIIFGTFKHCSEK